MTLSKPSKYAIRAVLFLASKNESEKFSPSIIAEEIDVPTPILAKTLQVLVKNNIISSSKGRNGGFFVTKKDKKNSLLSVIKGLSEYDKLTTCFMGLPRCSDKEPCPIHYLVKALRTKMIKELSSKTIEEFAEGVKNGDTFVYLDQE